MNIYANYDSIIVRCPGKVKRGNSLSQILRICQPPSGRGPFLMAGNFAVGTKSLPP